MNCAQRLHPSIFPSTMGGESRVLDVVVIASCNMKTKCYCFIAARREFYIVVTEVGSKSKT